MNKIKNIFCNRFNNEHLQYNTHSLYKFKTPKMSILQSHAIPSQKKTTLKIMPEQFVFYL